MACCCSSTQRADAVNYALAYQKALSVLAPPLKARAGLHVGNVTLRENSPTDVALGAKPLEVEGVAKAIAARVMSIAMGGQMLLSSDARQLSDEQLRVQSHGHWRMKGVDEPIELFEVARRRRALRPATRRRQGLSCLPPGRALAAGARHSA